MCSTAVRAVSCAWLLRFCANATAVSLGTRTCARSGSRTCCATSAAMRSLPGSACATRRMPLRVTELGSTTGFGIRRRTPRSRIRAQTARCRSPRRAFRMHGGFPPSGSVPRRACVRFRPGSRFERACGVDHWNGRRTRRPRRCVASTRPCSGTAPWSVRIPRFVGVWPTACRRRSWPSWARPGWARPPWENA